MTLKFARAPLFLALSLVLAQSVGARSLIEVDRSLVALSKRGAVVDSASRLQLPMRNLPSAFDAKSLGVEGAARAHLGQLLARQDVGKHTGEAFELHSVSPLAGGAHIVQFTRRVNGIEVFREDIGLLLDVQSRLVAFRGRDALLQSREKSLPEFVLGAADAAALAMAAYGYDQPFAQKSLQPVDSTGDYQWFAATPGLRSASGAVNRQPLRVKPVYFPVAGEGLVPAYYVETRIQPHERAAAEYYAHVLSAVDGRVLFRHFQQADVGTQFDYRVWANTTPPYTPLPSPHGRNDTPHPTGVDDGYSPPFVLPSLVTLSNAPFSMGDPWLDSGATETTGNNTDTYADITSPDGFGAGDLRASITAPNVFDRTYDVNQEPGASLDQRMAAVTQQFYWVNWLHDFHYDAGFAEIDGNAQASNYGRGGLENDRLLAEAQDSSGLNNANMATPADGANPRMQMFVFSPVSPHTLTFNGAEYPSAVAAFGPQSFNIADQNVVAALDVDEDGAGSFSSTLDGCSTPFANAAAVAGNIVLINRGGCGFTQKVKNAQTQGAVGVVVANNVAGAPADMGGVDVTITIGSMIVGQADGQTMRTALADASPDIATLYRGMGVARDGTIDGTIIAHEWGHYISNRLIGNANGLSNQQGSAMGEGWADFNAMLTMVSAEDANIPPFNFAGTYSTGSYATGDAYFGIRRYPYSLNMTKNPLMFRHIQTGVALPAGVPRGPGSGADNAEVHNAGEVWATALWECYASLLNAHPFQEAQDRMKRYVIGGYKLTPSAPTFLEARDALLAAALAVDPADFVRFGNAFARRGMGVGAVAASRDSTTNAGVVESTSTGADLAATALAGDDNACDNDGFLDRDESGSISVDVRNTGWVALGGGSVSVTANDAGVVFPFGNSVSLAASNPYSTQSVSVPVRLDAIPPSRVVQFTATPTEASIVNPPGTARSINVRVATNEVAAASAVERFGANIFPWSTALANGASASFVWYRTDLDSSGNRVAVGPDSGGPGSTSLVSDPIQVGVGPFSITLTHRYQFEGGTVGDPTNWDGGQVEISTDNGANWASIGGAAYDGTVNGDSGNPMQGQAAFVGTSAGYPATMVDTIDLGTTYANQTVRLRFTVGTDAAAAAPGWELHAVALTGAGTPFAAVVPQHTSCSTATVDVFYDGFE